MVAFCKGKWDAKQQAPIIYLHLLIMAEKRALFLNTMQSGENNGMWVSDEASFNGK